MGNEIVILGAGIAGIGAGYKYKGQSVIYEQRDRYGGLCDNFTIQGFRFDYAVHLSFATETPVRNIFDKVPYYAHNPIAMNYANGVWAKHPIQNNSYNFTIEERINIVKSFINRDTNHVVGNYEEWLKIQYGEYFTNKYPSRYTRKYWCCEAKELTVNWIEGRMYIPTIDEVLEGALTTCTPNTYYAKEMRYPKKGGYRSFIENVASECQIELNHKAIKIDGKQKIVEFENGKKVQYKSLISSLPLPEIVKILDKCPEEVIQASLRLKATSICLVSIGFSKIIEFPSLWFYVYDEEILFARAYSPSLKSPDNAPENKSSLQFEIYFTDNKRINMSESQIIENVIASIELMKIAKKQDIDIIDVRNVKYANVVFYQGMEEDRKIITDYLVMNNIKSIGRFGVWDYLWSNQSFLSGYNTII